MKRTLQGLCLSSATPPSAWRRASIVAAVLCLLVPFAYSQHQRNDLLCGFNPANPGLTIARLQKGASLMTSNPRAAGRLLQLSDCPLGYAYLSYMHHSGLMPDRQGELAWTYFEKSGVSSSFPERCPGYFINKANPENLQRVAVFELIRFALDEIYEDKIRGNLSGDLDLTSLIPRQIFLEHPTDALTAFGPRYGSFRDNRTHYIKSLWLVGIMRKAAPGHIRPLGSALTAVKHDILDIVAPPDTPVWETVIIQAWDRLDAAVLAPEVYLSRIDTSLFEKKHGELEDRLEAFGQKTPAHRKLYRSYQMQTQRATGLMAQVAYRITRLRNDPVPLQKCRTAARCAIALATLELMKQKTAS